MRKVLVILLTMVLIFSLYKISLYLLDSKQSSDLYGNIAILYHEGKGSGTWDIKKIQDIDPNIIGWITIPNTKIDYPVVKGKDNEYYLNHDVKGNETRHGAIFMDYRNEPLEDDNIIVYGHHMKDGTMFKDLVKFKEREFFDENRYIYLDIGQKRIKYEIFSVYIADADFPYTKITFDNNEEFEDFYTTLKGKSLFPAAIEFSEGRDMLTLSTCTYEYKDARLVLHALSVRD